ncbi:MAG: hypothetical protein R3225_06035 [Halofilum sp. (in: g-proteobacteria)]|nr:hypothetical protein [Halofilum sp. (in: g-proteobacteria)]
MCRRSRILIALVMASFLPTAWALAESEQRRDPLRPPGEVKAEPVARFNASAWKLTSTLVADGRRVAIINDRAVQAGDRVGGARVLAIDSGRVRLDYRGRKFTITRPGSRVKMRRQR